MLMTAGLCGGTVIKCFPEAEKKACGIYLVPTPEANQIKGKVQICQDSTFEHYGIVVELDGRITFAKGLSIDVVKVFSPGFDSATVMKSTVNYQLFGKPEGLLKDLSSEELKPFRKRLHAGSHICDFTLHIPTDQGSLPPTITTRYVDINYSIIVYKRTNDGYEQIEQRPLKFYGYHCLQSPIVVPEPRKEFGDTGIGISGLLTTSNKQYLRNEEVHFTLEIKKKAKEIAINSVLFKLVRIVRFKDAEEVQIVETFTPKKLSKSEEFCLRGVFKSRKELPCYQGYNIEISYLVKCEITTPTATICEGLDIIVGTTRVRPNVDDEFQRGIGPIMTRRRAMSCVSLVSSTLSIFPPSYSNLPSRSGSIVSLESLPPHYDDVVGLWKEETVKEDEGESESK